ncbi:hypothetical protein K0T92_01190 [Paenibacillus oenotherae]|uniref:Uncharacterized protein n=1 Tax=Paenibacillus oenotherae TaxID=1435645 RepID=A0ABS7D0E6_9BACL|nr:hypothetical protein [Paenibacillus oenotherae]MBW7473354.1 hypothetical protein [Paenibacillus oenotherae]
MKKLFSAVLMWTLLLSIASQTVSAANTIWETTDVSSCICEAQSIQLNDQFMGYLGAVDQWGFIDYGDAFKWTNTTDHDIAIEAWLYTPLGIDYELRIRMDGYNTFVADRIGSQVDHKASFVPSGQPRRQIIIKPGHSASFWVLPSGVNLNPTKNYKLKINEIPIQ